MKFTAEGRISDLAVYPALEAIAELAGRLERRLFVDLYVRGRSPKDCKKEYIARWGLTARQFNSIASQLRGRVEAARESRKRRIETLRGRIAATEEAIRRLQRQDRALASGRGRAAGMAPCERAARRRQVRFRLHQKKRRLYTLQARLEAEQRRQGPPSLCFGSRKLFRAQFRLKENGFASHDQWRRAWREARSGSFLCLGSKDEVRGNQTCSLLLDGTLRIRVPHALVEQYGSHVAIRGVRFPYGQEVIEAALRDGRAISYRFVRRGSAWHVHATTERTAAPLVTDRRAGALGVDLNPGRLSVAEVDRSGNPVCARDIPLRVQGRRREQVRAALGDAVADVVNWARVARKPVVVERLDFEQKKARLREAPRRTRRKLSHFAYASFHALLVSRAAREGVEVIEVNPAFTTVIGTVKFGHGYGLSPHAAAAVAIARRGLGFGERLRARSGSALPLPERNRGRHVWSDWRRLNRRLKQGLALFGRRPPEGGRGRGRPLSAAAPARGQGPPCDGLAPAPGCDSPAQTVGKRRSPGVGS